MQHFDDLSSALFVLVVYLIFGSLRFLHFFVKIFYETALIKYVRVVDFFPVNVKIRQNLYWQRIIWLNLLTIQVKLFASAGMALEQELSPVVVF